MPVKEDTSAREIVISRLISAPRELVFNVWTDPKHMVHWWGPNGFTTTVQQFDVRPGGTSRFIMHGPDGTDWPNRMVFIEVVKPERLVYVHGGEVEDPSIDFHVTITFEKQGDKTLLTMRSLFSSAEERNRVVKEVGAIEGGNQTLNRLEEYLKGQ